MPKASPEICHPALSERELRTLRNALLAWFERQQRDLPWRRTRDPYAIWISEIMLQQTRVAAAIPFYQRFLERFPNYRALAQAPEQELLAHWAGLGYYHRARNLQKAVREIEALGAFPDSYEQIRALPGVGDYTAAAVASIAFGLPYAAVDGNVLRVLSRVLADSTNIHASKARRHFSVLAGQLLDETNPGAFNQAMMELGATVCLPVNPQCLMCPLHDLCRARRAGSQNELPVKGKRGDVIEKKRRLFWIERGGDLLLWQRPPDSRLMAGFWELPEHDQLPEAVPLVQLGAFTHSITVYRYRFEVWRANEPAQTGSCRWVPLETLESLPLSTILRKARRFQGEQVRRGMAAART